MSDSSPATPDYVSLIDFLVRPFLEAPDSLRVDCESSAGGSRLWVRLAFEGTDKGRVFGRGGRNVQAIRTVVEGIARSAGQSVRLDVFGSQTHDAESDDRPRQRSVPGRPTSDGSRPRPRRLQN